MALHRTGRPAALLAAALSRPHPHRHRRSATRAGQGLGAARRNPGAPVAARTTPASGPPKSCGTRCCAPSSARPRRGAGGVDVGTLQAARRRAPGGRRKARLPARRLPPALRRARHRTAPRLASTSASTPPWTRCASKDGRVTASPPTPATIDADAVALHGRAPRHPAARSAKSCTTRVGRASGVSACCASCSSSTGRSPTCTGPTYATRMSPSAASSSTRTCSRRRITAAAASRTSAATSPPTSPSRRADPAEETERWLDALEARLRGLQPRDASSPYTRSPPRTPRRSSRSATSERIPPVRSHIAGLFVSTTAQIYPQDRGMSEGVRTGYEAADAIHAHPVVSEPPA